MKADLIRFVIILFLVLSVKAFAEDSPRRNNEVFVKEAFQSLSDSLFRDMVSVDSLRLEFKCGECPSDFFVNILIGLLKQKVSGLYIDNGKQPFDRLQINLYNYGFYYDKNGGSLFSGARLNRNFRAGISAVLVDSTDRIVWQYDLDKTFSQEIAWNDAKIWEKRPGGLFHAALPPTNRSRLWEPLLISGLLGGLVYLFFASR